MAALEELERAYEKAKRDKKFQARLNELLHSSSLEDRPLMEQTLAQVNQVQTETMLQVFRK